MENIQPDNSTNQDTTNAQQTTASSSYKPEQTSPTTHPLTQQSQNKLIASLVTIIFILIAVIGFFAYDYFFLKKNDALPQNLIVNTDISPYATPSSDPQSDWQVYENDTHAFTFKYPSDWEVRDLLPNNKDFPHYENTVLFLGLAPKTVTEDALEMIEITKNSQDEVIRGIKTLHERAPTNRIISENNFEFLGYPATEIVSENTLAGSKGTAIVFTRNGLTYSIVYGDLNDASDVNAIYSTLKFHTLD